MVLRSNGKLQTGTVMKRSNELKDREKGRDSRLEGKEDHHQLHFNTDL